jgi:serine/threonine-protein kinase
VDSAGDLFAADTGHNRVVEFTPGGLQTTLAFSGLSAPYGVAVDAAGDVYAAGLGNNRVVPLSGQPEASSW